MKPSKPPGILKKKQVAESELLAQEAERMQQRLEELKEYMQKERVKRDAEVKQKDGSRWRSGRTDIPIKGYVDKLISYKPRQTSSAKAQTRQKTAKETLPALPILPDPPTSKAAQNIQRALETEEVKPVRTKPQLIEQVSQSTGEDLPEPTKPAKSWLYEDSAWNPFEAFTDSAPKETTAVAAGTSTSTQDLETAEGSTGTAKMISCWDCFQLFDEAHAKTTDKRRFCSAKCQTHYIQSQTIECPCGQIIPKADAVFELGVYHCSEACIPPIVEQPVPKTIEEEAFIFIDPTTGNPVELNPSP